jgi:predicted nucleotidyltransferase
MYKPVDTRADVLERIVAAEEEIRGLGVRRLALFGSFVRSEARSDSDVDLLVEFVPGRKSFDGFMQLYDLLEERLGRRVELVTTEALSPYLGPRILAEAEDVVRGACAKNRRQRCREA